MGVQAQLYRGIWKRPRWFCRAQKMNSSILFMGYQWLTESNRSSIIKEWRNTSRCSRIMNLLGGQWCVSADLFHFYFWWCSFVHIEDNTEKMYFHVNCSSLHWIHLCIPLSPGVCNTHAGLSRYTPLCLSSQRDCLLPIIKPFIKLMGTSPILNNFSSL